MSQHAVKRKIEEVRSLAENSVDGYVRPPKVEEQINVVCRNVLNTDDGDAVMDYIKSISINAIMHPSCTDAELRMQEGMRRLAGILDHRRKTKPKGK